MNAHEIACINEGKEKIKYKTTTATDDNDGDDDDGMKFEKMNGKTARKRSKKKQRNKKVRQNANRIVAESHKINVVNVCAYRAARQMK